MDVAAQDSFHNGRRTQSPSNEQQPPFDRDLFDVDTASSLDSPSPMGSPTSNWSCASPTNQVLVLDFEHGRTLRSEIPIEPKGKTEYKIHGVNVLNRQSINGFKAIEKIRRRRQSHALSERKRTSTMNGLIAELAETIPEISELDQRPAKSEILRIAVNYVKQLQSQNQTLKSELTLHPRTSQPPTTNSPNLRSSHLDPVQNPEIYATLLGTNATEVAPPPYGHALGDMFAGTQVSPPAGGVPFTDDGKWCYLSTKRREGGLIREGVAGW